jgi:WD40 repeat protein
MPSYRWVWIAPMLACTSSCVEPGTVKLARPPPLPPPVPCTPDPPLPDLGSDFLPSVGGALSLASAKGDDRLSAQAGIVATWSPDSAYVAFDDSGWLTLWHTADGSLVDHVACVRGMASRALALSPDRRWIVTSGIISDRHSSRQGTCIVDLRSHATRIVPIALGMNIGESVAFDAAVERIQDDEHEIELASGAIFPRSRSRAAAPEAAPASSPQLRTVISLDGLGGQSAISHDGRYLAAWTVPVSGEYAGECRRQCMWTRRPPFVGVWDRITGKQLWSDRAHGDASWQFSPDDRFLEAGPGRSSTDLLRVTTGEVVSFPGTLLGIAPDGQRAVVLRSVGPEIWAVDPPHALIAPARPRGVFARSSDGTIRAAYDGRGEFSPYGTLVIERAGACVALGISTLYRGHLAVDFSPDARLLYAGVAGTLTSSTPSTVLDVFATDTGALRSSVAVAGLTAVYPMAHSGRVGFGVDHGIRIFDAMSARPLFGAEAPRISLSAPGPDGKRSYVRNFDGDSFEIFSGPAHSTADGRYLVGPGELRDPASIWDLANPRGVRDLPLYGPRDQVGPVELSPDERHIAAAMWNGAVLLWTRAGTAIAVASHHEGIVTTLAFSPDGRWLASAGEDGTIQVTDTETGARIGGIALVADHAIYLSFDADGRLFVETARRFEITVAKPSSIPPAK